MPETARLCLRPLQREDAPAIYRLTSRPDVARYMRFSAHTRPEQAAELVMEYTAPGCCAFAIQGKKDGTFCGVFAFKAGDTEGDYTLSIFLDPAMWNKGYATELLAAMVSYAQTVLGAKCLTAYVVESNLGSRKVLEKQQFIPMSVLTFPDFPDKLYIYSRLLDLPASNVMTEEEKQHV